MGTCAFRVVIILALVGVGSLLSCVGLVLMALEYRHAKRRERRLGLILASLERHE